MKYIGPDFFQITDLLTEEELAIQKTAHDFVKNEFMPVIQEHFREGTFPLNIISRLGEIGVLDPLSLKNLVERVLVMLPTDC